MSSIILRMRAVALVCAECGGISGPSARGWQGYLVDAEDDGGDEVVFYCPDCAREFGECRNCR
jgi:predicted RNA-binding Zn-ribbon protein involved in translation (DUF1610 family)